ncbi:MAG: hypothetical protein ACOCOC_04130 [Prevotella sp.]
MEINRFDTIEKVKWLTEHNLLCKQNGFKAVTASGPENMEGVMAEYRKTENFIVIDDTSDNRVYSGRPGWFTRSTITVWIMAAVKYNDGDDYNEKMKLCREIFRQFVARLIYEKQKLMKPELMFLDLSNILYKELGRYSINGACGLYFMIDNEAPTDLTFKQNEWE